MNRASRFATILAVLSSISLSAQRSYADIAITAQEVGSDVVFSYSGSIDLTGLFLSGQASSRGALYPVNSFIEFGPNSEVADATFSFTGTVSSAPPNIGTGSFSRPTSSTGSYFSINNNSFKVPLNYVSGSQISGSITLAGKSLAGLGVDSSNGTYTWGLPSSQEVTLSFLDAVAGTSGAKAILQKKIKKLKKQIKRAKKKKKVALLKKLKKKQKKFKKKLKALG